MVKILSGIPNVCVVCEATGGYETLLKIALQKADINLCIMPPHRTHAFSEAMGQKAKTDAKDAEKHEKPATFIFNTKAQDLLIEDGAVKGG